jgi:hypothetical protein
MQYIFVSNATYYQSSIFSQHVSAVYDHRQMSIISLKLLHSMASQNFHTKCKHDTS